MFRIIANLIVVALSAVCLLLTVGGKSDTTVPNTSTVNDAPAERGLKIN